MGIFNKILRINFATSLLFECARVAHFVALFLMMQKKQFGALGILFSIVYAAIQIGSMEGGNALIPYANAFTNNKKNFIQLIRLYALPQALLLSVSAIIAVYIGQRANLIPEDLHIASLYIFIIFEGMRASFRHMLHAILLGRIIAIVDTASSYGYFIFVWSAILIGGYQLSLQLLWYPFVAGSVIAITIFLFSTIREYYKLPVSGTESLPSFKELTQQRAQLILLHAPKNIFSGNILVPFFGYTLGASHAATLKIISHIANSFRAITTSVVGFSGAALFTKASRGSANINRAFQPLWKVVLIILLVLSVAIITTIPVIANEWNIGIITIAFFSMAFLDYIFIIYEQMFLSQKKAYILAAIRTIEIIASYAMLIGYAKDPAIVMGGIIVFRSISFSAAVYFGYKYSNVWPSARINSLQIMSAIGIGIMSAGIIHIVRTTFLL